MKYWRGYLTAGIIGFFTWALMAYAKTHAALIDMVYPYVSRMVQSFLSQWSSGADALLWQLVALLAVVVLVVVVVMAIVWKWNLIQLVGWVLAVVSLFFFLHTGVYGLNQHAGPLAEDIRLNLTKYNLTEMEEATVYYRDNANALARQINRGAAGSPDYADFDTLAQQAGDGFYSLTYDRGLSVFAGDRSPVKKLGWADYYTSVGITGIHMPLTGESAVNPQIPAVALPFAMCHEMSHRMCIANERDANFAAFLACDANSSLEFRYSAYFMAYHYCLNALASLDASAAARVRAGADSLLTRDMAEYDQFFADNRDEKAAQTASAVNDAYIKISGDQRGTASYGDVVELLVSWHIQEVVLPQQAQEEQDKFDPYEVKPDQTGGDIGDG